ncbi:MAG: hypothetical protein JRH03_02970 [Deltaproteobacteria bacterium]|nr:hypothetical protein [Deltaproteobacteria bacterium]
MSNIRKEKIENMPAGDLQELAGNAHGQWQAIDGPKGFRQILFLAKAPGTQSKESWFRHCVAPRRGSITEHMSQKIQQSEVTEIILNIEH